MITSSLAWLFLGLLLSCNRSVQSSRPATTDRCFELREGKDVAYVRLHIEGNAVSGDFLNLPYEKDAAIGTLRGTLQDSLIAAKWFFTQEGIDDTIAVAFQLAGRSLLRQEWAIDSVTGRYILNPSAPFVYTYTQIPCAKVEAAKSH